MSQAFMPPEGFEPYGQPGTFMEINGPIWVAERSGGQVLMLPTGPQHANAEGAIGGGLVMTLLAASMGVAVSAACATQAHCPALGIDTRFLGLARAGQILIGAAEVERVTSAVAFASATLTADGQVVGKATGVFRIPPAVSADMAARRTKPPSSGEAK